MTDREIYFRRGEDELIGTRDELEPAVTLHKSGYVGEPPGIDVDVLVGLPSKEESGGNIVEHEYTIKKMQHPADNS